MEPPSAKPPRLKRIIRRTLFVLAALITIAALVLAEENWRGARAWHDYKRGMEAKGERFDLARIIPPTVPDEENFAMTPLFAPLFTLPVDDPRQPFRAVTNVERGQTNEFLVSANRATNIDVDRFNLGNRPAHPLGWSFGMASDLPGWAAATHGTNQAMVPVVIGDPSEAAAAILEKLKSSEPLLAELQTDATRRYCRFNISYEKWRPEGVPGYVEHLTLSKWLVRFLSLHAEAEMALGRTDQALKDINVLFRIDDGLKDEPLVFSQLVRMACIGALLEPVGEGLAERRWSEEQLRVLQERLQTTDLMVSATRALRGERDIIFNANFDQGVMFPRGWNRFEQANVNRAFQDAVVPRIDLAARKISPGVNHSMDATWKEHHAESGLSALLHHDIMAKMMVPIMFTLPQNVAFAQSQVDMAMLACALERYRLAEGRYPDDLNALVPRFVPSLPRDIVNGQPLKYRRDENGRFILYSVGWNEKDDGGVVASHSSDTKLQDILHGDWVLQYPEKSESPTQK